MNNSKAVRNRLKFVKREFKNYLDDNVYLGLALYYANNNKKDVKPDPIVLQKADVAIEFTNPSSAKENVMHCLKKQIPVVCGTTGWKEHIGSVELATALYNTAFLIASNFSIGVNLFFELNSYLANLMQNYTDYAIQIKETHHTEKKDAPSGTAISLAEQIIAQNESKKHWHLGATNDNTIIPIEAIRQDPAPGTHEITYSSSIDDISIIHTAHNRNGFALGAVMAAAFIHNKKGIFTMKDVLFKNNTLF